MNNRDKRDRTIAHGHADDLPVDSDIEVDDPPARPARPLHLRWSFLALAAGGGAVGTTIREASELLIPLWGSFPLGTFLINVTGAFVLGALLESLARRGPDEGRRRALRLFFGTGVLGGFTTYSSLATDTALQLSGAQVPVALVYSLATLLLGGVATWVGIAVAHALHRVLIERHKAAGT
jgi:CrcB protein